MSESALVKLDGVTYAAGLMWLMPEAGKARARWTMEQARRASASWYAQRARQTGFWMGPEPEIKGTVTALAHLVEGSIGAGAGSWQALLACDEGRCVLVRGNADEIFPRGDLVFEDRDEARRKFRESGDWGALYASAGLVDGARPIKLAAVAARCVLTPAPFGRRGARKRLVGALAAAIVLGGLGLGAYEGWRWYERHTRAQTAYETQMVEEIIREGVDVAAFLGNCVATQTASPALPPMWEEVSVACWADAEAVEEISGSLESGALFSRWRMNGGNEAMARRVAEARLDRWDVGAVLVGTAWGALSVAAPVRQWDGEQPSTLSWRKAMDRAVGTLGRVIYQQTDRGFVATLQSGYPVSVVGPRLEAIPWLDVSSVVRTDARWEYRMGRVEPQVVLREETVLVSG